MFNDFIISAPNYFCKQLNLADSKTTYNAQHQSKNKNNHFYAKYSKKKTQFFENGFPQAKLPHDVVHPGKVLIRPAYVVITNKCGNLCDTVLQWECSQIFWTT